MEKGEPMTTEFTNKLRVDPTMPIDEIRLEGPNGLVKIVNVGSRGEPDGAAPSQRGDEILKFLEGLHEAEGVCICEECTDLAMNFLNIRRCFAVKGTRTPQLSTNSQRVP